MKLLYPKQQSVRFALATLTGLALSILLHGAASADEVLVGHLSVVPIESLKAAEPHTLKLSAMKPASIVTEPQYRATPMYGSITLGTAKTARLNFALDTFPKDKTPFLYIDINGSGNLTGKSAFFPLKPLTDFTTDHHSSIAVAPAQSTSSSGVPIGVLVPTLARYDIKGTVQEVKCPVLFTLLGDELDYTISVERLGTVNVAGKAFRISLVDMEANQVYDVYQHSEDKPALVKLLIDRNDDGRFDLKREAFDVSKPFRLNGSVYELASIDPVGTIVALQPSTKQPEGGITPDEFAVGTDILDFSATDIDGKPVHFPSDYKHKIVLLDFWALSDQNSATDAAGLVNLYTQYHKNGFEIVGVSLDRAKQKQNIQDFCQQSGMVWPEIYDGGGKNAAVAKLYGIERLPRKFLVDGTTGTILAMGAQLDGPGLQVTVTSALRKKRLLRP